MGPVKFYIELQQNLCIFSWNYSGSCQGQGQGESQGQSQGQGQRQGQGEGQSQGQDERQGQAPGGGSRIRVLGWLRLVVPYLMTAQE